jgi:hypothetical protein
MHYSNLTLTTYFGEGLYNLYTTQVVPIRERVSWYQMLVAQFFVLFSGLIDFSIRFSLVFLYNASVFEPEWLSIFDWIMAVSFCFWVVGMLRLTNFLRPRQKMSADKTKPAKFEKNLINDENEFQEEEKMKSELKNVIVVPPEIHSSANSMPSRVYLVDGVEYVAESDVGAFGLPQ